MSVVRRMNYCINGEWLESNSSRYMPVTDSSTGEVIAEVPCCTEEEVESAIEAAQAAFPAWSQMAVSKRASICSAGGTFS